MQPTKEEIKAWKDEFIQIFNANIKREGADKLLAYLESSDFFCAPASTRYHNAFEGGLCCHSINVYKRYRDNVKREKLDITDESIALCALLHDVCKIGAYVTKNRNKKIEETGKWVLEPYLTKNDTDPLPYGHGEKSVYIVGGFLRLSREEAMAINWHMGPFDDRCKASYDNMSAAYRLFPSAMLLYLADMAACYLDEDKGQ